MAFPITSGLQRGCVGSAGGKAPSSVLRFTVGLLLAISAYSQTTISDTIYAPIDGTAFTGTMTITAPNMTYGSATYVAWTKSWTIKAGVFSAALIPNDAATPAGTSYSVRYVPTSGSSWSEVWVVTTSVSPLEIWQVRVLSTPVPTVTVGLNQLDTSGSTKGNMIARSSMAWGVFSGGSDGNCIIRDSAQTYGIKWGACATGSGAGDVGGPLSSQDGGLVLFDGTTGKLIKEATGSGVVKVTSGVFGVASAGTDYERILTFQSPLNKAVDTITCPTCIVDTGTYNNPGWITGIAGSKITGAVSTATALAANPTDCGANNYATTIDSGGNLTCAQVAYSQVTGTPTIYYQTIQISGADQGQRAKLNMIAGTNVNFSVSSDADSTDITINSTASGGSGYQFVQEEGVNIAQRLTLNFIGSAITAADDAGMSRTNITVSQSPAGSTSLVGTGRQVSTTTPLAGGGNLGSDLTITCSTCLVSSAMYDNPSWMNTLAGAKITGSVSSATSATTATAATALASNPSDCSANQYATTIDASGNLTCSQVAYSQVSGTPTIYYQTVQKTGADQTQRAKLNFIEGSNITITMADTGTATDITIASGAGGGSGYTTIYEEGVALTQRANMNFIGAALTAADDAGNSRTNVTLSQSPVAATSVVGTSRQISTSSPLGGGGDLTADRTLTCSTCVVTTGSYDNPTWMAGLVGSKISGAVATATALASNPTDCTAGQYANTIDVSGNLTCAQVAYSQLSGAPATENPLTFSSPLSRSVDTISCPTCVVTTGSYDNPTWMAGLVGSKITGAVATATALAGNPTDCGTANTYATAIDASGNLTCSAISDNQTNQKVAVLKDGVAVGTRKAINLVQGGVIAFTAVDNAVSDRVDVTFGTTATLLTAPASAGMLYGTTGGSTTGRTITAGTGITVTNGDGAAGNPTITADGAYTQFHGTASTSTLSLTSGIARIHGNPSPFSAATAQITAGSSTDTAYVYITNADTPVLTVATASRTINCTNCTPAVGTSFPAGSIPLYQWTITGTNWDTYASSFDKRASQAIDRLELASTSNLSLTPEAGKYTIGVDATSDLTWTGAADLSGATTTKAFKVGTSDPASGDCDASGEVGRIYLQSTDPATDYPTVWACTHTGASTYAWISVNHRRGDTAPSSCSVGETWFDTNATAGSNWYGCTATDTWTALGGGTHPFDVSDYTTEYADMNISPVGAIPSGWVHLNDGGGGLVYDINTDATQGRIGIAFGENRDPMVGATYNTGRSWRKEWFNTFTGKTFQLKMAAKIYYTANVKTRIGIFNTANVDTPDGIYFEMDPSHAAHWHCVIKNGGTTQRSTADVTADTDWHTFVLSLTASGAASCTLDSTVMTVSETWPTFSATGLYIGQQFYVADASYAGYVGIARAVIKMTGISR